MNPQRPIFMCLTGGGFMAEAAAIRGFIDPHLTVVYSFPRVERKLLRERFPNSQFFVVANISRGRRQGLRRNPLFWVSCVRRFMKKIKIHNPKVGIFIGSVECLPAIIAAKLTGMKIIFIESLARTENLSVTGRIVYYLRLSDQYFVQWPYLAQKYQRSEFRGLLQPSSQRFQQNNRNKGNILVTVGSNSFDDMIKSVDSYFTMNCPDCDIIYQIGCGYYIPTSGKSFRFSSNFDDYMLEAKLIITHGGALTVLEAIWSKKPVIAVPNPTMSDDHQRMFLKNVCNIFNIKVAWHVNQIEEAIANFTDEATYVSMRNLCPEINCAIKAAQGDFL